MKLYAEWSAPANMLVAGEYAITRPGGLGLSVATSPRGRLRLYRLDGNAAGAGSDTSKAIEVVADMEGKQVVHSDRNPLAIVTAVADTVLGTPPVTVSGRWRIEIDTRPFFERASGTKLGLGSSAVAALLLTAAFQEIADTNTRGRQFRDDRVYRNSGLEKTITAALDAHRRSHGGRGSGYDVVTSAVGGAIRFTGGARPLWTSVYFLERFVSHGGSLFTWNRGRPVSSRTAVGCFEEQIPPGSDRETTFLQENNAIVEDIERTNGWTELFGALHKAAHFGAALGEEIGVSAQLPFVSSHMDDGWIAKASGAGNEGSIIFATHSPRRPLPRGCAPTAIETEGLLCRYHTG